MVSRGSDRNNGRVASLAIQRWSRAHGVVIARTESGSGEGRLDRGRSAVVVARLQRNRLSQSTGVCEWALFCQGNRTPDGERRLSRTSGQWQSSAGGDVFSEIGRSEPGRKRVAAAGVGFDGSCRRGGPRFHAQTATG